jgi:hypothetical protein
VIASECNAGEEAVDPDGINETGFSNADQFDKLSPRSITGAVYKK